MTGHWPQTAGGCLIQVQKNVKLAQRNWDWLFKAGGCLIQVAAYYRWLLKQVRLYKDE